MRLLTLLGTLALGFVAGKLATASDARANPGDTMRPQGLMDYRWEARPVLVFAPSEDAPLLVAQRAVFAAAAEGLTERDIVVHTVLPDRVTPDLGTLPQEEAPALRARFRVAPDAFAVILVGKDGTQKLREDTVLTTDRLFATIDAMPMRRREMRDEGAAQ
ncbi:MAG: DUF4174 domain-containing protein [Pseudomonadota bacterium]